MDLRLLKYFVTVAEELHFTNAAKRLGITQPTLSHQIRVLEDQLGTILFHRDSNSIEITEAGYILLRQVNQIFYELDKAKTMISELDGLTRGSLSIGSAGHKPLYKPLMEFHQRYPDIKVSIYDLKTEETIEKLLNSELDLGLVYLPVNNPRIHYIPLLSAELFAITSRKHELAKQKNIAFEQLIELPLFLVPRPFHIRKVVEQYSAEQGFAIQPKLESTDTHTLIQMAVNSFGFTILPKMYTHFFNNDLAFLSIEKPIQPLQLAVIYRKGQYMSPLIKVFLSILQNVYAFSNDPVKKYKIFDDLKI